MHTEGEAPAGLVRSIAQGPGAHIRKHGYDYTKRLNKEIVCSSGASRSCRCARWRVSACCSWPRRWLSVTTSAESCTTTLP